MVKVVSFVAPEGDEREGGSFRSWYLRSYAPHLVERAHLRRCVVNLADKQPLPGSPLPSRPSNGYAVVVELWCDSRDQLRLAVGQNGFLGCDCALDSELRQRARDAHAYVVDETYQLLGPHSAPVVGTPSAGVKMMTLLLWQFEEPEAKSFWRSHAARALPHHPGLTKYVQNWVMERHPPAAPAAHAIAELHWPSLEALRDEFVTEEGAGIVAADGRYQRWSTGVFATEHLLCGERLHPGLPADFLAYRGG